MEIYNTALKCQGILNGKLCVVQRHGCGFRIEEDTLQDLGGHEAKLHEPMPTDANVQPAAAAAWVQRDQPAEICVVCSG